MIDVVNKTIRIAALPRTGRQSDIVSSGGGEGSSSGGGGSALQHWRLVVQDAGGDMLESPYIESDYTAVSKGDIIAYISGDWDLTEPLAGYDAVGMARFNEEQFNVVSGLVSLKDGIGGEGSGITDVERANWNAAFANSHTHNNKSVLDDVTSALIDNWNAAYASSHTHSNKSVLDGITATLVTNWNTAYTNNHTHDNKACLDVIDQNLNKTANVNFNNVLAAGDVVAYSTGAWNLTSPIAGYDAVGMARFNSEQFNVSNGLVSLKDGAIGGGIGSFVITGSGNAVTTGTYAGNVLTLTKGLTFALQADLTSHTGNTTVHITATERTYWTTAYNNNHTHSNKSVLDGITSTLVTNWNTAYTNNHTHSNKAYLDVINQNLSKTSDVNFKSVTASSDVIACASGTWDITAPVAGASTLGMIKVGSGLTISNGVLNAAGFTGGTITSGIVYNSQDKAFSGSGVEGGWSIQPTWGSLVFTVGGTTDVHHVFKRGTTTMVQIGMSYCYSIVSWSTTSDIRLKNREEDLTAVLEKIKNLDVFYYTRKDLDESPTFIGSSAQQLQTLFPEFVQYDEYSDRYGISYNQAGYSIAVAGLKEVAIWMDDKDVKIASLEARITELETRLNIAS